MPWSAVDAAVRGKETAGYHKRAARRKPALTAAPSARRTPGTATGIVRSVDDLGRIVIPKEIRRTLKIREGDPLLTTLIPIDKFYWAIHSVHNRIRKDN